MRANSNIDHNGSDGLSSQEASYDGGDFANEQVFRDLGRKLDFFVTRSARIRVAGRLWA
jgi:hypothetical protein